jgi:hypothetical protein
MWVEEYAVTKPASRSPDRVLQAPGCSRQPDTESGLEEQPHAEATAPAAGAALCHRAWGLAAGNVVAASKAPLDVLLMFALPERSGSLPLPCQWSSC